MMAHALLDPLPNDQDEIRKIEGIPVRNLWLLMLYASDLFRVLDKSRKNVEENPDDIADLVAELLCYEVERRIRRNLSYGYQSQKKALNRIRGRVDLFTTERHQLLNKGKIACHYSKLTVDTARNRYVRAALEQLAKIVNSKILAHRCKSLATSMIRMGVIGQKPSDHEIFSGRFGRHDLNDRPMVATAKLAFNLVLPTEISGTHHLSSPDKNINWIRKIFEKGVAGFYKVVLPSTEWGVKGGRKLDWQIERESAGINKVLPLMQTDIILDHLISGHRIIIDTKFTSIFKQTQHKKERLDSGYIYQMYAYLRSQEKKEDPVTINASGLLLHPSIDKMVNEFVIIQNHEIRFATVDLGATAKEIRKQLLDIIKIEQ